MEEMMCSRLRIGGIALLVVLAVLAAGCSNSAGRGKGDGAAASKGKKAAGDIHPSKGPHGGALAEWGEEEYHVEFTVDHGQQQATVYVLDGTAKKAKPIPAKQLTLALKQPVVTVTLEASPQEGDPAGSASRFVGKEAALAQEQEFAGTISGEVRGKPYAGDFAEKEHDHKHEKK
jgi:hypothetical protein